MVKKRFHKTKIAISLDKDTLKKIDSLKSYPQWSDNRSYLIEEAINKFLDEGLISPCTCLFCKKSDKEIKNKNNFWIFLNRVKKIGICYACIKERLENEK